MLNRIEYVKADDIALLYSEESDRLLIYNMAFEEDSVWQAMLEKKEDFDYTFIQEEEPCFFDGKPGLNKYLLIEYKNQVIGTISHTYNDGKTPNFELDMWLRSEKYIGKGIGTRVLKLLTRQLAKDYQIKTFLIRPWIKNPRAIQAYKKCGFIIRDNFVPENYYGKYLEMGGDGDYPQGETCNMILEIR